MATYIVIFLFELLVAYILWFLLRKIVKTTKFYRFILFICLIVSLGVGYVASHRYVGYDVTMDYLTEINDQRMEETGQGITLQEENEYKEELFQTKEFQALLRSESIKSSLPPFILVIFIMLLSTRGAIKKLVN